MKERGSQASRNSPPARKIVIMMGYPLPIGHFHSLIRSPSLGAIPLQPVKSQINWPAETALALARERKLKWMTLSAGQRCSVCLKFSALSIHLKFRRPPWSFVVCVKLSRDRRKSPPPSELNPLTGWLFTANNDVDGDEHELALVDHHMRVQARRATILVIWAGA